MPKSFTYILSPALLSSLSSLHHSHGERKEDVNLPSLMLRDVQGYAIFTFDTKGRITSWNPESRYLFGYTEEEAIGKSQATLFPEMLKDNHISEDVKMALKKGQHEHVSHITTKSKKKLFIKCTVTSLWGENDELMGFSKIIQDITPQIARQKNREEFIKMVGHEVKNPITSIKAYLQLLELKLNKKGDTELSQLSSKAISQVDRLSHLVRDILDSSRIDIGKLTYHDTDDLILTEFIQEILDSLRVSYPEYKLILDRSASVMLSQVDKGRLEQVILNLLTNAIKYSPDHEDVHISVQKRDSKAIVQIQDKGIGIPKREQKCIFQKFYRGENAKKIQQGLGLGLHLVREIVTHYNGKIWVESGKGKGSTFYMSMPTR